MNTIKTPEQIAQDTLNELDLGGDLTEGVEKAEHDLTHALQSGWIEGDTVLNMIRAAIEADRAQRAESVDPDIPTALLEAVGADFQDGEALWYFPAEQVPGWFDAVIHHEDSGRIVRYAYEDSTDTVTAHEHGKVVEVR